MGAITLAYGILKIMAGVRIGRMIFRIYQKQMISANITSASGGRYGGRNDNQKSS